MSGRPGDLDALRVQLELTAKALDEADARDAPYVEILRLVKLETALRQQISALEKQQPAAQPEPPVGGDGEVERLRAQVVRLEAKVTYLEAELGRVAAYWRDRLKLDKF